MTLRDVRGLNEISPCLTGNYHINFLNSYMNVKERIKERVNAINDPRLLNELLKAVELEHEIEHLEELSAPEKRAIDEGISDAEAGKLHSNSEASQLVKQWLKK